MLTEVKKELKIMFLSIKYNIMKEMVNPLSFILNILLMMLNNSAFIVQWIVLFSLTDSFGSYGLREIMLLWGLSAASYGVARILFGGAFKLPAYIENGKLDSYLVLPKNTLFSVISSHTVISAIGDLLYGLVVAIIAYHSLTDILLILLFIVLGGIIETAFAIIVYSMTFWLMRSSSFADNLCQIFTTLSIYPDSVYSEAVKFILYTIVPVGFSVFIPMKVIMSFSILNLLIVLAFTILISLLSYYVFFKGLKRYTSSNLMVAR